MPSRKKTTATRSNAAAVLRQLRSATRVLITSHVSPDGDAVGSVLALAALAGALEVPGVVCALHDPVPRVYEWMPGSRTIRSPEEVEGEFDLVVLADANTPERTGRLASQFRNGARVVIVDHHLTESDTGDVAFIDPRYAATGEMVADLFEKAHVPLTREVAECIYVALSTDTGNFRYANTTARSHRIAAKLIDAGIDVRAITSRVIDLMSIGKFNLLRRVLERARLSPDGCVAHACIPAADLKESGALNEDVDGLINYLRNLEGVQLAMLFRESADGSTKVSFRSQGQINSADIAQHFGGGGHAMAAGATLPWPMDEARDHLFDYLRNEMNINP